MTVNILIIVGVGGAFMYQIKWLFFKSVQILVTWSLWWQLLNYTLGCGMIKLLRFHCLLLSITLCNGLQATTKSLIWIPQILVLHAHLLIVLWLSLHTFFSIMMILVLAYTFIRLSEDIIIVTDIVTVFIGLIEVWGSGFFKSVKAHAILA